MSGLWFLVGGGGGGGGRGGGGGGGGLVWWRLGCMVSVGSRIDQCASLQPSWVCLEIWNRTGTPKWMARFFRMVPFKNQKKKTNENTFKNQNRSLKSTVKNQKKLSKTFKKQLNKPFWCLFTLKKRNRPGRRRLPQGHQALSRPKPLPAFWRAPNPCVFFLG